MRLKRCGLDFRRFTGSVPCATPIFDKGYEAVFPQKRHKAVGK